MQGQEMASEGSDCSAKSDILATHTVLQLLAGYGAAASGGPIRFDAVSSIVKVPSESLWHEATKPDGCAYPSLPGYPQGTPQELDVGGGAPNVGGGCLEPSACIPSAGAGVGATQRTLSLRIFLICGWQRRSKQAVVKKKKKKGG